MWYTNQPIAYICSYERSSQFNIAARSIDLTMLMNTAAAAVAMITLAQARQPDTNPCLLADETTGY